MFARLTAAWHLRRATRRYAAGDFDGALGALERSLAARPGLPLAAQYLGVIALKRNRVREAEDHLRKAGGGDGDPFVVNVALGAVELLRERYEAAEARFREALAAFPVAFEVGYHVGMAKWLSGDETGALAEFTRLLAREDEALFVRLKRLGT